MGSRTARRPFQPLMASRSCRLASDGSWRYAWQAPIRKVARRRVLLPICEVVGERVAILADDLLALVVYDERHIGVAVLR